jgi:plasmid replication initiation protein
MPQRGRKRKNMTADRAETIQKAREMQIYKSDDMVQKGRHKLTIQEQRCVLYAISKIKPEDTAFNEYVFDIQLFYDACGIQNESYTELKSILVGLKSKCWWVPLKNDPDTESAVSWFSTVRTNKKTGKVTIKFHEDMMPYLLDVTAKGKFYTNYYIRFVLPMNCQYAPRLYELLKSYQKNNRKWFFLIDELKRKLGCEHYKDFYDFNRYVLTPSVEEINKYTDINVKPILHREGRKVTKIEFLMANKSEVSLQTAIYEGNIVLDGQMGIEDYAATLEQSAAELDEEKEFWEMCNQ